MIGIKEKPVFDTEFYKPGMAIRAEGSRKTLDCTIQTINESAMQLVYSAAEGIIGTLHVTVNDVLKGTTTLTVLVGAEKLCRFNYIRDGVLQLKDDWDDLTEEQRKTALDKIETALCEASKL